MINQLPQNNNGHNTNIEQRPSVEYTQLFNNVLNDYNKAKKAWDTIKQQKYKTRRLENMVLDFTDNINKNIAALERDKANYNALKEKNRITSNPQPIGFSGILLAKRQNSFYCTYFLHNRNVADTKSPYPIKRLEVIRWFNQKSMVFNQSLS